MSAAARRAVLAWQQTVDEAWLAQSGTLATLTATPAGANAALLEQQPEPPDPDPDDLGDVVDDVEEEIRKLLEEIGVDVGRLDAAVDQDIEIAAITPDPIWRTTEEPLFRSDDRSPEAVFLRGFSPTNPDNVDLASHVFNDTPSAFVATSTNEDLYQHPEYRDRKYLYQVDAPGGIDVLSTLPESRDHFPGEDEIAFPGGLQGRFIEGAFVVNHDGTLGPFLANPYYDPD